MNTSTAVSALTRVRALMFAPACFLLSSLALAQGGGITTGGASDRPIFVSGVVVMENGSAPPVKVAIELLCQVQSQPQGKTDEKGAFNIQLGINRYQGNIDAATGSAAAATGFGGALKGQTQVDGMSVLALMGCSLRAVLEGYRSDMADLSRIHVGDTTNVGTIVLHPFAASKEYATSINSLAAPKNASSALDKAREHIAKQQVEDAEKELRKAIRLYPKYAEAWQELGGVLQIQKKNAEARKAYLESAACDAQYSKPYLSLARLSAIEKNWQDALQNSEMFLKLDPSTSAQAYYYSAVAHYNLDHIDKAFDHAQRVVSLDPNHTVPLAEQLLGVIYLDKGDDMSAVEHLRNYLSQAPPATNVNAVKALLAEAEKRLAGAGSWFKASKVADGVWCIDDHGSDNMYLVEGKEKALLIDTGMGVAKLSDFVKTLTRLPVIVVNTHGHPDHAGGNNQFQSVYAHPLEFEAIRQTNNAESRKRAVENMMKGAAASDMVSLEEAVKMPAAELLPLKDGQIFDLGGRKLAVIETPGHTPGEIVLLDPANRIVFTGDNDNSLVWLFLPTCTSLEVYLQSLKKLQKRDGEFDTIMPGHGIPLPKSFVAEQVACVEQILDGTCKGDPYKSFAGDALVCRFKSAAVAFNPQNLRVRK
jgi:hydroxyacylglutathione hydrolase